MFFDPDQQREYIRKAEEAAAKASATAAEFFEWLGDLDVDTLKRLSIMVNSIQMANEEAAAKAMYYFGFCQAVLHTKHDINPIIGQVDFDGGMEGLLS